MGRCKKIIIGILITVMTVLTILLFISIDASASGLEDGERIDAMEKRLADYEINIGQIRENIDALAENDELQYEQRLSMQQQLDVVILGLGDLIGLASYEIEKNKERDETVLQRYLSDDNLKRVLINDQRTGNAELTEIKEALEVSLEGLASLSVSGNELVAEMNDNLGNEIKNSTEKTLLELNETLTTTNKFLSYLAVLLIFTFVVILLIVFGQWIKNTLTKHIE
jgi:hypothetical protein